MVINTVVECRNQGLSAIYSPVHGNVAEGPQSPQPHSVTRGISKKKR